MQPDDPEFERVKDSLPTPEEVLAPVDEPSALHHELGTVFGVAAFYTPLIQDGRTDLDVLEHMESEVVELRAEIEDPENPGPDGIFGEAVDVIACCVDIIRRRYPDMTIAELERMAAQKMQEKCLKWKSKAEAGLYPYQQR